MKWEKVLPSTVYNINEATNTFNNDLNKITVWAHQ